MHFKSLEEINGAKRIIVDCVCPHEVERKRLCLSNMALKCQKLSYSAKQRDPELEPNSLQEL